MILTHGASSINRGFETVVIGDIEYPVVRLGRLLIISKPLRNRVGDYKFVDNAESNTMVFGLIYKKTAMPIIESLLPSGWRFLNREDGIYIQNNYNVYDLLSNFPEFWSGLGNNSKGTSFVPAGGYNMSDGYQGFMRNFTSWTSTPAYVDSLERLYNFAVYGDGNGGYSVNNDTSSAVVSNYRSILVVKDT